MQDSDDDMPPPLEDMSAEITAQKEAKDKVNGPLFTAKTADHTEEVRLAPKKKPEEEKKDENVSKIAARDDYDFDKKPEPKKEELPKKAEPQKKKNQGFGGFSAGFLNAKPQKPKAKPK